VYPNACDRALYTFCVEKVRIEALTGKIFNFNEITKITECRYDYVTLIPLVLQLGAKAD
jgi:hypothetical protein